MPCYGVYWKWAWAVTIMEKKCVYCCCCCWNLHGIIIMNKKLNRKFQCYPIGEYKCQQIYITKMCKRACKHEYIPIICRFNFSTPKQKRTHVIERKKERCALRESMYVSQHTHTRRRRKKNTTWNEYVRYVKWKVDQGKTLMKNSNRTLYLLS